MNTKDLKTIALAAVAGLALGFAPCANAEPTLTDVKAQTHYPWDGKVDLSYTTQGVRDEMIAKGLELSLRVLAIDETTHMTNTATPAALSGDMTFADGTHAFVWDMDKQGLKEINSDNVVFKVTCMAADGDNYEELQNKPSINDIPLVGNQAATALKIFAPTTGGTAGQVLVSGGANAAPGWGFPPVKWKRATNASYATGSVDCYRQGNVVCIRVDNFNINSGAAAGCVTIPDGYKPNTWVLSPLMTTSCACGGFNINPSNGKTQLFGSQNTSYYGSIVYFTNDAMPK